jgi:hypothetical protein
MDKLSDEKRNAPVISFTAGGIASTTATEAEMMSWACQELIELCILCVCTTFICLFNPAPLIVSSWLILFIGEPWLEVLKWNSLWLAWLIVKLLQVLKWSIQMFTRLIKSAFFKLFQVLKWGIHLFARLIRSAFFKCLTFASLFCLTTRTMWLLIRFFLRSNTSVLASRKNAVFKALLF